MYGKVFRQMYDSTVATNWKALVTFQQFIILADSDGVVDMTPEAISRYTNIPLEIIQAGIAELEKPDPKSRSKEAEGRRLERLDPDREWGWYLVNYEYYANLRTREEIRAGNRERKRRQREKGRHGESHDVTDVTSGHTKSLHIDREVEGDRERKDISSTEPALPPLVPVICIPLNTGPEYPIYQGLLDEWNALYPALDVLQELRKMRAWVDANPSKRKTKSGIKRFCVNWLNRSQDRGGSGGSVPRGTPGSTPRDFPRQ
ncbi:MAG TPA: hypothetical protein VGH91_04655 [Gammaproteobacteria bacterium]|jgi:hypothetical protein